MTTSFYDLSVPTFLQTVLAVEGLLARAAQHCAQIGTDPDGFVPASPATPSISALSAACAAPSQRMGLIEIGLPGGVTLRAYATASEQALRRVLAALGTR